MKPQLDTDTVLTIIKMLDVKIDTIELNQPVTMMSDWQDGMVHGLEAFRDHLQDYIEGLVTQAENNLNAGD